jgi:UDP-N-acetylmuramate--alanine ligase
MGLVRPVEPVPVARLGRVHFAAIGGAGMSGVARIMLARGVEVSGCDSVASPQLDELAQLGARVSVGHSADHVAGIDTLVVSSAIRAHNPELVAARAAGKLVLHRAAALASVMLGRQSIVIAGTHGKTTTTSMITTVLRAVGADPSYAIGGVLAETGVGAFDGSGAAFVAEADESDGSFLMFRPDAAVITCVEADHLDNWETLARIEDAFLAFVGQIAVDGLLVIDADDPGAAKLASVVGAGEAGSGRPVRVVRYGESESADYRITEVRPEGMSTEFVVTGRPGLAGAGPARLRIAVPGRHNARNAAAAYAIAVELGFEAGQVAAGLARYGGAKRRMEVKGEVRGVRVLDSYAHHPTELAADLTAAAEIADGGRVIAVFQPHLFSRTRFFAREFATALGSADEVFVLDIYAAREDPEPGVTGALVADAVPGGRAMFVRDNSELPEAVADVVKPGDVVLTMGAGDVTTFGPLIVAELRRRDGEVS